MMSFKGIAPKPVWKIFYFFSVDFTINNVTFLAQYN